MVVPEPADPKRQVILVSKDINMRIKARALGCWRRIISTTRCWAPICCTRNAELPADFWDQNSKGDRIRTRRTPARYYRVSDRNARTCWSTSFFQEAARNRFLQRHPGRLVSVAVVLMTLTDYTHRKMCLGHHGTQPRAEFRPQPADEDRRSIS